MEEEKPPQYYDGATRRNDPSRQCERSWPNRNRPFKKTFGSGKHKFPKRKYEVKEESEGGSSGKPTTPRSYVKRAKQVESKNTTKKCLCFKYGGGSFGEGVSRERGRKIELNSITIAPPERQADRPRDLNQGECVDVKAGRLGT